MDIPNRASDAGPNQKEDPREYITRGRAFPNPLIDDLRKATPEPTRYAHAVASQEDAALVVAMAERAAEDGALILGARLTKDEFNALEARLEKGGNRR